MNCLPSRPTLAHPRHSEAPYTITRLIKSYKTVSIVRLPAPSPMQLAAGACDSPAHFHFPSRHLTSHLAAVLLTTNQNVTTKPPSAAPANALTPPRLHPILITHEHQRGYPHPRTHLTPQHKVTSEYSRPLHPPPAPVLPLQITYLPRKTHLCAITYHHTRHTSATSLTGHETLQGQKRCANATKQNGSDPISGRMERGPILAHKKI